MIIFILYIFFWIITNYNLTVLEDFQLLFSWYIFKLHMLYCISFFTTFAILLELSFSIIACPMYNHVERVSMHM